MAPRLPEIRRHRKLRLEDVAATLEVAISTVSRWESGDANIPTKRFPEIASAYQCRVADIFGDQDVDDLDATGPKVAANDDSETIDVREVDIGYAMGPGTNIDDYAEVGTMRFGLSFLQKLTRAETDMLFVARGDGDSMSPTLINGDTVLIDRSQRTLNMQDRIWAVSVHGAGMIKRLRSAGQGKVRVLSDNPTIPPDEVAEDDLHIVGRVIWVGRRV